MLLSSSPFNLSDEEAPRLEEQMKDGTARRIDIATGATIIEVKKRLTNEEADTAYIEQLRGYVIKRMRQERSRYNGILTDGKHWWLYEQSPADNIFARRSTFELSTGAQGSALVGMVSGSPLNPPKYNPDARECRKVSGSTVSRV